MARNGMTKLDNSETLELYKTFILLYCRTKILSECSAGSTQNAKVITFTTFINPHYTAFKTVFSTM